MSMADVDGTHLGGRVVMKGTRFFIDPFIGHNDFTLRQQWVKNILTREDLKRSDVKSSKSEKMTNDAWEELRVMVLFSCT